MSHEQPANFSPPSTAAFPYGSPQNPWRSPDGGVISCAEKLKVLQENMEELRQCALDALEDAVLMGCDEAQVKEAFPYGSPQNPWRSPDGGVISCAEKLKVMQENMEELRQCALDALEDAVLMGCDEAQVKEAFIAAIAQLDSGYAPAK